MNSTLKIEKSVPIPVARSANLKYPFTSMKVGDSFFIDGPVAARKSAMSASYIYSKITKTKFTSRSVTEDGVEGLRIWRIA